MSEHRIMVIEDNQQDLIVMEKILHRNGYDNVVFVPTGEEAIQRRDEIKPSVIICDTVLPGMDGVEACRQLREICDSEVKIIVQTGHIDAVDAGRAREAGADDYVVKASDCAPLLQALKEL